MAVSRLAVLLVAAALLIPVTYLATRHSSDSGRGSSQSAAAPAPAPAPSKAKAAPAHKPASKPKTAAAQSTPAAKPAAKPLQANPAKARQAQTARDVAAKKLGVPRRVAAALAAHRVVVLFFSDGRGADDKATAQALKAAQHRVHRVSFFKDRLRNLGDYRLIVGNLGITQSPSVVIVGQRDRARVVEGYVDSETLLQQVIDARR